jgi:hypothetical protein
MQWHDIQYMFQVGDDQELQRLADSDAVSGVHPDVVVTLQHFPLQEQTDAPWYLDRLDQDALPLDKNYHYILDGSGINVYVFDTVRHP